MQVDKVEIGKVVGHFGIRGEMKIRSFCRPEDEIFHYNRFFISSNSVEKKHLGEWFDVKSWKKTGSTFVLSADGINCREDADKWIGKIVYVSKSQLPDLEDVEYFWRDLIGLNVDNMQNKRLGKVVGFIETRANDIMTVQSGSCKILIPWDKTKIHSVDIKNKKMIIDCDDYEGEI